MPSQSVTRNREALNRATEVLASGVDFDVGASYKVVGELEGPIGNPGTIVGTLGVLSDSLKTLREDFNCSLETVGILKDAAPCGTNQYTRTGKGFGFGDGDTYRPSMGLFAPIEVLSIASKLKKRVQLEMGAPRIGSGPTSGRWFNVQTFRSQIVAPRP